MEKTCVIMSKDIHKHRNKERHKFRRIGDTDTNCNGVKLVLERPLHHLQC